MRKAINKLTVTFSDFFFWRPIIPAIMIVLGCNVLARAVPVIPNEASLEGTVIEYCLISSSTIGMRPDQVLLKLVIYVEEVKDIKDFPNFLRGRESPTITLYSKVKEQSELYGKRIKARVYYKGDERGGRFWIQHIEIIKE